MPQIIQMREGGKEGRRSWEWGRGERWGEEEKRGGERKDKDIQLPERGCEPQSQVDLYSQLVPLWMALGKLCHPSLLGGVSSGRWEP